METNSNVKSEEKVVETDDADVNASADSSMAAEKTTSVEDAGSGIAESSLRRLAPALIVSISIMLSSGILSATSFSNHKNMPPQVRNFYYQLPPPGPYMSNLDMPRPPAAQNAFNQNHFNDQARPSFRPPQMTQPPWVRPVPPWQQAAPSQQFDGNKNSGQANSDNQDQKSALQQVPANNVVPPMPPQWARPAPPMPSQWARPAPPMPPQWARPAPPMPRQGARPAPPMPRQWARPAPPMPPQWARPAPPMPPQWARPAPPMPPQWARPAPPGKNNEQSGVTQNNQQAVTPRATPPWMQLPKENLK
ncbi:hypothetical protein MNBD_GAMMA22-3029 [hydrothermal vent metagenome]|uniref:Uncharacterized protein n=1 Tax=hydrothermal vent metagenome TaxID=652676 RepID=A0A3B0ZYH1_9ZZZZ